MAAGVRNSSRTWSSLRSISSRRRRTSERLLSKVIDFTASEEEAPAGGLGHAWLGPQLAERIEFGLFTLRRWQKCACSLLLTHHLMANCPLGRSAHVRRLVHL